jgi:ribosomal protein S18 acetylase RimI-like enzyme
VRIRRARPDDALAIATVYVRSWKGAYPGLIPQSYLDALRHKDQVGGWKDTLDASAWPHTGVIVLLGPEAHHGAEDGPITGFVSFSPARAEDDDVGQPGDAADDGSVGEILTFYLDPTVFGSGGADLLMSAALVALRGAHFDTAVLWVLGTNARARRFYERHGWRPDGTSKLHDWGAFVASDLRYVIDVASVAKEAT